MLGFFFALHVSRDNPIDRMAEDRDAHRGAARASAGASEAVWQRRILKRITAVRAIKSNPEYAVCAARPSTPDPHDRTITKRRWETSVQIWRAALRGQGAQCLSNSQTGPTTPLDWLGGPEPDTRGSFHELKGSGVDQHGSTYVLASGSSGCFHVSIKRPSGRARVVFNLVRIVNIHGHEAVVWGKQRYQLEIASDSMIKWHGRSVADTYIWTRTNIISSRAIAI